MQRVFIGISVALALAGACAAQEWEVGGMASYGFYRDLTAAGPAGSALAGFNNGTAYGAVLGYNSAGRFSGELRYSYLNSDLKLSSGGTSATFSGIAHAIHYDVLFHPRVHHGSRILPFAAAGFGIKDYIGTGTESAYQPLENIALLTKTHEVTPMISVGGGIKMVLGARLLLRAEMRDYITTFPTHVITPLPGTHIGRWLNDFVPMVGISYVF